LFQGRAHPAPKQAGRSLRCAPPQDAKMFKFERSSGGRGAHGVRALPVKPDGQHSGKEARIALLLKKWASLRRLLHFCGWLDRPRPAEAAEESHWIRV